MAHFAKLDKNNTVIEVLVIPDAEELNGEAYLHDLGILGKFVQTSYNATTGGKYAAIGDTYDPKTKTFISPTPPAPEPTALAEEETTDEQPA